MPSATPLGREVQGLTSGGLGAVEAIGSLSPFPAGPLLNCGPKVLLAEDHPISRKVVELILGTASVQLISVENGEEALKALRRETFDLVFMDTQMPVMDGLSAIRRFRELEQREGSRRTPIVSLTANALPEQVRASFEAGADEHMLKPIKAAVLLDAVFRLAAPPPLHP